LKTGEGWQYLVIVLDLFGLQIIGWHTSKRITPGLIEQTFFESPSLISASKEFSIS
jgi:hypothetical protein